MSHAAPTPGGRAALAVPAQPAPARKAPARPSVILAPCVNSGHRCKGAAVSNAAITGWGKCLPPAVLSNTDLATLFDTSDEWITSRTGIRERRISHVGIEEMAYVASMRALACAGVDGGAIDLIVFGTCSHDDQVPNQASSI